MIDAKAFSLELAGIVKGQLAPIPVSYGCPGKALQ
jgi:hypothetical protein